MKVCPCCGQSLPEDLPFGLRLAKSTALLLETVRRAGPHGISSDVLFDRLYQDDPNGGPDSGKVTMYTRIYLINKQLRPRGKEIRVVEHHGRGGFSRYALMDTR